MIYLINHSPPWLLIVLFSVLVVVSMLLMHKVIRLLLDKYTPGYKDALALNIHNSVSTLLALVVAFSLVQAVSTYRQVEHIVRQESVRINNLDRLLTRYGNAEVTAPIRIALKEYAQSIVVDEWPEMDGGHHSLKTEALFKPVSKGVIEMKPSSPRENSIYNEMIKLCDSLADSRNDRLDAAEFAIPGIFWLIIIVMLVAKTVLSAFAERARATNIIIGAQMVCFATLLCLTFSFDEPLKGEAGIKPTPLIEVIDIISKRTS
ncbi:DUF4239 domain-containing protein [Polynucleobacter paneuropaeus]|nr:DUF4239 domain-containing protein [Polynucleobacter paneuropaeus]